MKDLGTAKKILGMEILRDRKASRLYLSQKGCIEKVLQRVVYVSLMPVKQKDQQKWSTYLMMYCGSHIDNVICEHHYCCSNQNSFSVCKILCKCLAFDEQVCLILQEEGWVVCRAFKKRITGQTKSIEGWDSTYYYEEPSGGISVVDSIDYMTRKPSNYSQNFMCKQEIEAKNLNIVHSSADHHQFVQLPQLESPSLTMMKKPSLVSIVSENYINEEDEKARVECNSKKITADWRDLDKFVASQLSHGDRYQDDAVASFEALNNDSDLGLIILQRGREEGDNLNQLLSSTLDSDIGICLYNK
ncbi:NAC domain-containing protein 37-like [Olea europaea var. sylvestris]|uniref:NAC domain-containing protein 37-like n=1 Tax=Olea europaea var. sylvestris TaxID=158386 RepID=UPI000C1D1D32|nr:NAC domain-containing protein 37-like [Olea europaea var. sylvestris]